MSVNINYASGANTGYATGDPQNTSEYSLSNGNQNPQSIASSSSINNQTLGTTIPLQPVNISTEAIKPVNTTTHSSSAAVYIPIFILVIAAIVSCIYIYLTSKKNSLANT